MADRAGEVARLALDVGEDAVAPFAAQADDARDWLGKAFASKPSGGYSGLGAPGSGGGRKGRAKGTQVASLGGFAPSGGFGGSLSGGGGGGIKWAASASCLNSSLQGVISAVAANYGSVTVSSTCRSHGQNARAGGAKRSMHLTGDAADFRVHGNWGAAHAYLNSIHGGMVKHYGGGLFHIDTGAKGRF